MVVVEEDVLVGSFEILSSVSQALAEALSMEVCVSFARVLREDFSSSERELFSMALINA